MAKTEHATWQMARKEPFEAFGVLYYPLFRSRADLPTVLDDVDMAWAVTANVNLKGTGYTLSQPSILALAAYHHAMSELARQSTFLPLAAAATDGGINPLADLKRLVPDVTASPMYPDFPEQVLQIPEAQYRFHQLCHYLSTYGVEQLAGEIGLDVTVSKGWMPKVTSTPKTRHDETLVAPKVLHLLVTVEDLQAVVSACMARATRMHPAEIQAALLVFKDLGDETEGIVFPRIAFHENMMELIRVAAMGDSSTLERVATGLAQHPGDLLKAVMFVLESKRTSHKHLLTREKKGFCRAFEHFATRSIAQNIADAGRQARRAPNYLSVARFGGPKLREAIELVDTGQVRPWVAELETLWNEIDIISEPRRRRDVQGYFSDLYASHGVRPEEAENLERAWRNLLAHYGKRPGMLFRALARIVKAGCPQEIFLDEVKSHAEAYALPTLVRTLTTMSERHVYRVACTERGSFHIEQPSVDGDTQRVRKKLCSLLRELLAMRLAALETPLRDKRIFLDTAGVSLKGSVLVPNETGTTGTAWPPVGIAWDLPTDKKIRFFTFWDDRSKRVDVDLHFIGRTKKGSSVSVGWNSQFRESGMAMSGDITTSTDSVEYLDADMKAATQNGVHFVVQEQHIFAGASNWKDINTCYSGAILVADTARDVNLYNPENLIFRDDLTGEGMRMAYAVVNFPEHYVRILRGAELPLVDVDFCLGDYLEALFLAQGVTLVATPEEADLRVCIGRSDDPEVISLFDEGFFIG